MLRVLPITLRVLIGAACLFTTLVGARAATLDRVREQGMLRCGGVIRPGLAFPAIDHSWHGLEIEMCRAIATAVLGAEARIEFHPYVTDKDFGRLADGHDDVAFLTGGEIFANQMFIATLPGPAVFYQTTRVMVRGDNPAQHVADLRGSMICAEPGTGPERSLQAYMLRHAIPFQFSMWQELEEMIDAFSVGRCPAVAGEETALAALLLGAQADDNQARLLPEALSATPVLVATGPDPVWAGIADAAGCAGACARLAGSGCGGGWSLCRDRGPNAWGGISAGTGAGVECLVGPGGIVRPSNSRMNGGDLSQK
jgi:general L-amino acid transport system substrate-binding protein